MPVHGRMRPLMLLPCLLAQICSATAEETGGVAVTLAAKNEGECDANFHSHLWIPRQTLASLGMPTSKENSHRNAVRPPEPLLPPAFSGPRG